MLHGRLALRSALVVTLPYLIIGLPGVYKTFFAVAGFSSWNVLPVDLRSSLSGLTTFTKPLKTRLFGKPIFDRAYSFDFVVHVVKCDTVAVLPIQIIIIIKYNFLYNDILNSDFL